MNRLINIILFLFLAPFIPTYAQDKGGNVAIHTDPRLALLLNRTKVTEAPEVANSAINKSGTQKKLKEKNATLSSPKSSANSHAIAEATTEKREPKYLYNPDSDEYPELEKPTRNKAANRNLAISKDDEEARANYKKLKAAEKEAATNGKSSEEEIREYRESIEKERGNKTTIKKNLKTGIAADEVRYLTPTASGSSRGGRYNGTGYRVQIYYGTSREEAMRRKAEFMRHYPGIATYFSYASPTYRVKVGDYRRREDAISMFREANGTYSPCMIVPDVVSIH